MENVKNYIAIMQDSLSKKIQVLENIIKENDKQWELLRDETIDEEKFEETVEEKEKLIQKLQQLDSGFEQLYQKLAQELKENKDIYADAIKTMQTQIKQITDYSVQVQIQEARNQKAFLARTAQMRKEIHQVKTSNQVATDYYKNMNGLGALEPQFLDQKK